MAKRKKSGSFASRLSNSPIHNLIGGFIYIVTVVTGASWAYVLNGWSWSDAFYFSVVTIWTVG
jgi:voltage-gated potassium channel